MKKQQVAFLRELIQNGCLSQVESFMSHIYAQKSKEWILKFAESNKKKLSSLVDRKPEAAGSHEQGNYQLLINNEEEHEGPGLPAKNIEMQNLNFAAIKPDTEQRQLVQGELQAGELQEGELQAGGLAQDVTALLKQTLERACGDGSRNLMQIEAPVEGKGKNLVLLILNYFRDVFGLDAEIYKFVYYMYKFLYLRINERGLFGNDRLETIEKFAEILQVNPNNLITINSFFCFNEKNENTYSTFFQNNKELVLAPDAAASQQPQQQRAAASSLSSQLLQDKCHLIVSFIALLDKINSNILETVPRGAGLAQE